MSDKYDAYLAEHRVNVGKAYRWMKKCIPEILDVRFFLDDKEKYAMEYRLCFDHHDISKNSKEEYLAYDAYFYGEDRTKLVEQNFDRAWLMHIHKNPHHWQYWILIEDDGRMLALDMDYQYIIEMICDWWSFSWKSGNLLEIFDWYEKAHMLLSDNTRRTVEHILSMMEDKLNHCREKTC